MTGPFPGMCTAPATPPVFDALGSGGSGSAVGSFTWTHSAANGAYAVAFVVSGTTVTSVNYGGSHAMTDLGSIGLNNNGSSFGYIYMWGLASPPTGSQTLTATLGSSTFTSVGNSVSYTNVTSAGTVSTGYGLGGPMTQTQACPWGQLVVHGFGTAATVLAYSGGTERYSAHASFSVLIEDTVVPVTFAASLSSAAAWAGIGVVLL